ncbi:Fasciclin domain [Nesidiocoris tenuis]|uniref:Fasciclin domain n=1 Tax=Nesidiocoris tenuis TaxID=355587 RepID=A0ABN7B1R9_9HEMI|nr:Fasciclin domain [Nesidiocoris tenuis]
MFSLFQFYAMLEQDGLAIATLKYMPVTVFAPLNSAFQHMKHDSKDAHLVLYHMANSPHPLNTLGTTVNTMRTGNPPLWITRVKNDIYVNNAKILTHSHLTNLQHNHHSNKQVLHILDRVLEPIQFQSEAVGNVNPSAGDFLDEAENIVLGAYRLRNFRERLSKKAKKDIFKNEGKHTFFIPIDEGFQPPPRPEKIDELVIDGHVIPNQVLFTRPTPDSVPYQTLAFTDKIKVNISFSTEIDNNHERKYVKSHTIVGDSNHPEGVVLAEIVKANIPVKNGVVHLIHRPLMVVDTTVTQFLEDKEDGPLYKFYEVIRDVEGDFMDRLTTMRELTLFAPSNQAWRDESLTHVLRDRQKIKEILHMHLLEEKLPMEKIVYGNTNQLLQVHTLAPRRDLYFNVITNGSNKTLTVEGGGVNATVIQPDIAATNGIVHIIDKVLGVPVATVGQKMAQDPMLNQTYILGKTQGFNNQLNDKENRFTYFVPRDYAWRKMETKYPTALKKLFMRDFAYHAKQILERHLVVSDKAYSMATLRNMTQYESVQLSTVRDVVKIRVKEAEKSYYIEWNNEWIHVFRPDVECTNGIIHVIDTVFLRDSDITVTGGSEAAQPLRVILGFIVCLLISQYL